jgi:hypothetical protein
MNYCTGIATVRFNMLGSSELLETLLESSLELVEMAQPKLLLGLK